MTKIKILLLLQLIIVNSACAQVKANLTFKNYIKSDMNVYIESYDKKGTLKVNESFTVDKCSSIEEDIQPSSKLITVNGYKGGSIKIRYSPSESNTRFSLEPISVPDVKADVNQTLTLTGLTLYDVNDNKKRLISLGTELKFDSTTKFTRLIDAKQQLGSLIIGKVVNDKLVIVELIPLKSIDIPYDQTSVIQETSITERSVMSKLKLAIPVYGSVEAMMSSTDLNQVKWEISYYPFFNNTSFSQHITEMKIEAKNSLINTLKLSDTSLGVYLLRSFDVIESGIFSVTTGTKINTEANAAIASVFTANATYAFKAEDSKFVSIPNKAYNLSYEKWQSVGSLINSLEKKVITIQKDGKTPAEILEPLK